MRTSVRGTSVTALALGVLLMSAACGPSSQTPRTGSTTSASLTNPVRSSSAGRASPATPTATTSTTSSKPAVRPSTTTPTATITPSRVGRVVNRIPTSRKVVALTFDAGANGDGVDSILATLARDKVAGSFFLTGDFVDSYPTLARRMSAMGRLGNHTTNHPHLPAMTDAQVRAQIDGARTTILSVTGEDPRPFFRFPFGDSSPHDLEMLAGPSTASAGREPRAVEAWTPSSNESCRQRHRARSYSCMSGPTRPTTARSTPTPYRALSQDFAPQAMASSPSTPWFPDVARCVLRQRPPRLSSGQSSRPAHWEWHHGFRLSVDDCRSINAYGATELPLWSAR
jgi:Polysaccharide deacetylase